jgi:L-gulono-1,4-lactone dehydrogenase
MSTVVVVKLVSGERWRNWARTEATFVGRVHRPSSTAELVDVVRSARRRLTLVGSGHSWAPIARPDEEALSLERHDSLVRIDAAARTATVHAGMRLCDLNRVLAAHRLALPVLGTSSRQTVAGATATATHGTGARFQGLSSLIRSLELVTASGEVARVSEGDNARMFSAARASLGLLGVVAEVTLECEQAFNLRLVERPTTLDAVLDRLDELLARNEHFKFWWWPHTQDARTWEYNRTDEADTAGPLFRLVRDDLAFIYPGWLGLLTARVLPSRIPQLAQAYTRLCNRRRERTDRSDYAFTYPVPIRHFELEYGVPIDAAAEAVRGVRALIDREQLLVDFVLEVRFAAADDVWLSPAYARDTCYVGALVYRPASVSPYYGAVEPLLRSLGGRPHLGKMHSATAEKLADAYPRLAEFRATQTELDPDRRFGNAYLDRLFAL